MEMTFDGPERGAQPAAALSGQRLSNGARLNDRYEIEELLGPSPYGERYRARDLASGQLVAIQALAPSLVADAAGMERLTREVQQAVALDHKNIATTYGLFGAQVGADPVAYLAGEFVDGQSLREMLDKKRASGRAFSLKGAYNVIAHLCNALGYAHATTVHGRVTPESVMVNSAGRVKVCDFGLARALKDGNADARSDVYGVGAILFELLTGRPPADPLERASVVAPGVTAAVDPIIEICLRPSPEGRYADAQTLKEALQQALNAELAGPNAQAAAPIAGPPSASRASATKSPAVAAAQTPKVLPNVTTPPPRPALPPHATPKPLPTAAKAQPPVVSSAQPVASAAPIASSAPPVRPPGTPTPRPLPVPAVQQSQVPRSFNVDAALSAVDDQTERWLIQKDKLDFGPFNMREVRSQIETGKILGEHVIVDTENGERRKVKDHPQLRALVLDSEARLALEHKEKEEAAARHKHRARITLLLGGIFLAVIGGGGTIFWYYTNHQRVVVQKELVRDDSYDFMKGVEISMKVDPPAPKKPHPGGKKINKNGKNEFSDVTNLGDASEGGGDETLDQAVVQRVMTQNFRVLVGCIAEERRRNPSLRAVDMDFIIKGTGSVAAVKVNGQTSSPLSSCMYGKMQSVTFPKFNGAKTHASFSLALK
jgi:serine/threonine-protein kinase